MSVVCAKVYKDRIDLAADSIMVFNWAGTKRTDSSMTKLTRVGNIVIGAVGTANECGLMWNYIRNHQPLAATEKDVLDFFLEFYSWISDFTKPVENTEKIKEGDHNVYIIALDGKAFEVSGTYVCEITNFNAIGAGQDYALAALHLGHTPREAVKVACDLCCYVAEPVIEESMPR